MTHSLTNKKSYHNLWRWMHEANYEWIAREKWTEEYQNESIPTLDNINHTFMLMDSHHHIPQIGSTCTYFIQLKYT